MHAKRAPGGVGTRVLGLPSHRLRRDELLQPAVDRQRLQVREPFLKSEALLVEVVARPPQLQGHLPGAAFTAREDRGNLVQAPLVVSGELRNPARCIRERTAVGRKDQVGLVARQPPQAVEVLVEGIWCALGVQADVR